eukprot:7383417-Prymnesium_polylepis.1
MERMVAKLCRVPNQPLVKPRLSKPHLELHRPLRLSDVHHLGDAQLEVDVRAGLSFLFRAFV